MYSPEATAAASGTIFGPAVTVKMIETSDQSAPSPSKHFVDCNEPGKIMYIQQPKGLYSACWGGLMSTRAKYMGAEAAVIDGRMRDVREHREMGFAVRRGILYSSASARLTDTLPRCLLEELRS